MGTWAEIGPLLDDYTAQLRAQAQRELDALVRRAPSDVVVETSIEQALEPEEAILKKVETWKPDLLAVGTHGRHGLEKLVMGSIASKLLHYAETAVMLVRSDSELYENSGGDESIGPILKWREKLGARLVVMGSRGLAGLPELLVGSVAEKVARFCEVPVVIVK